MRHYGLKSLAALASLVWVATANAANVQNAGLASQIQYGVAGTCATCLAVDPAGSMYLAGNSFGGVSGDQPYLTKYSATASRVFATSYASTGAAYFSYSTTDAAGNLYLAGRRQDAGQDFNWMVAKITAGTSNTAWIKFFNGASNGADTPCGIAVDSSGNVYVAGTTNAGSDASSMAVIKFDSSGTVQWTNATVSNSKSSAQAMCLAPNGHVYVAGQSGGEFAVVSVDQTGAEQNLITVTTGVGFANAICCDSKSNVFVTGYTTDVSGQETEVLYLNSNDLIGWNAATPSSAGPTQGMAAQFDYAGNAIVCSVVGDPTNAKEVDTVEYNPTGGTKWSQSFKGLSIAKASIGSVSLAVDKYGDSYLSGSSFFSSSYPEAAYFLKYNPSGTQMFTIYHGVLDKFEVPTSLAIDANSDVYAVCYTYSVGTSFEMMALHWTQAPIANNDSYSVVHGNALTVNAPGVLTNDTFTKGALVTVHANPTHGTLAMSSSGSFKYTPTSGYIGTDTFQYTAAKPAGGISNVATVTIKVT
jgi:hypothetical protein